MKRMTEIAELLRKHPEDAEHVRKSLVKSTISALLDLDGGDLEEELRSLVMAGMYGYSNYTLEQLAIELDEELDSDLTALECIALCRPD